MTWSQRQLMEEEKFAKGFRRSYGTIPNIARSGKHLMRFDGMTIVKRRFSRTGAPQLFHRLFKTRPQINALQEASLCRVYRSQLRTQLCVVTVPIFCG